MKVLFRFSFFLSVCIISSCFPSKKNAFTTGKKSIPSQATAHSWLVDKNATNETAALFYNLKTSAKEHVLFGHMDDNKSGYDGWKNIPGRSDVLEVTGAYPAMFGFDFGGIASLRTNKYSDSDKQITHDRVIDAYKLKGVITFSWHYNNPVSKGSFYWKQSPVIAVNEILPNGNYNKVFTESLKKIALFAASVTYDHKLVPIIFRPFHEFDGDWFWWGKTHCTTAEYKALYQYTVTYLRDSLKVKNFLYAWSPDCRFISKEEYLERYPGNNYVDIVGIDDYYDLSVGKSPALAASKFKIVSDFALEQNKVAALTETGLENVSQPDWYTQMLLKALKANQTQLAYVMVWTNRPDAYWTPYKGHPAASDFIAFKNDSYILFGDKIGNLYKISKMKK